MSDELLEYLAEYYLQYTFLQDTMDFHKFVDSYLSGDTEYLTDVALLKILAIYQ